MKILMFGWELPPYNAGGLGVACLGLIRALIREGVDVVFVLPKSVPTSIDFTNVIFADKFLKPLSAHKNLYEMSYKAADERFNTEKAEIMSFDAWGHPLIDEVSWYAEAAIIIAKEVPHDIIHAHDWLSFPAGMAAKRVSGRPLVAHFHATEFDRTANGNVNQTVYNIEYRTIHEADQIITVSNFTKRILIDKYNAEQNKITVVHNGIDKDDIVLKNPLIKRLDGLKKSGYKIILFTGRLTIQKGPDYFLKMAQKVIEYEPKAIFVIAGSGDMERQLIEETAWQGLGNHVLFAGFIRGEELGNLYGAADILVMPSVSEPFGLVPLESLLNETPVLISNQSGVSEVLKHALKVDFWDTDEAANKIISVLRHKALRETLKIEGMKEALSNGWHKAAKLIEKLYRGLIHILQKKF